MMPIRPCADLLVLLGDQTVIEWLGKAGDAFRGRSSKLQAQLAKCADSHSTTARQAAHHPTIPAPDPAQVRIDETLGSMAWAHPNQIADMIRANPDYDGSRIKLVTCSAAKPPLARGVISRRHDPFVSPINPVIQD